MTERSLLHEQFTAVAQDLPDQRAVVTPRGDITYGKLEARSSLLAQAITPFLNRARRVLICLDPGITLITAMLAVLKADACYALLHRKDPVARIAAMTALPGADLLITDPEMKHRLDKQTLLPVHTLPVHTMDELNALQEKESKASGPGTRQRTNSSRSGDAGDHAYIIHTSGSTGAPKAMGISHAALNNLLASVDTFGPLGSKDRCSLWAALNFDASAYEIWSALCAGATLFLPEESIRFSPDQFLDWLAQKRITSAFVPPFMMEDLARHPGTFSLNRVMIGVEPLAEPLLCQIKKKMPGATLLNGYGPAEATVCVTLYSVPPTPSRKGRAPVGKPVKNITIDLVDHRGHKVPRGSKGEIIIRGVQVSDGYLNAPGQNAAAFDTTGPQPAYRTGDMGLELEDGNLLFLGRKDFQIKFKGVRIEPGEIESLLRKNADIAQAALVLKTLPGGSQSLVAYVTARPGKAVDTQKLLDMLRQMLPRTMMPAALICLDKMPLTPQGKTDRQALSQRQDPQLLSGPRQKGSVPPHHFDSPESARIADIWERVLESPVRSGNENFLLLGGDSIAAAAIMARINHALGLNLSLNLLFEFPEFHRFSRHILAAPRPQAIGHQVRAEQRLSQSSGTPIPLMPDQELIWLFETLHPKTTVYHLPLVFEISGSLDIPRLERAINRAVFSHPALGFIFAMEQDKVLQQWAAPKIRLAFHDLGTQEPNLFFRLDDPGIRKWIDREIRRSFNLTRGPLIRAALLKVEPRHFVLCFTVHHLVFDGWSAGLFIQTLGQAYSGLTRQAQNQPAKAMGTLPDPVPGIARFHDHVLYKKSQLFRQWPVARSFFKTYLSHLPPLPSPESDTQYAAACCPLSLDISLYVNVKTLARQQRTTRFAVLLALFQITMALQTDQKDQVTGFAYAGRDRLASESITGCLMNTMVVRNKISFQTSFYRFLGQMKKTLEAIWTHRDIPFHTLQAYCQKLGQPHEIFDTLFLMQTMPMPSLELCNEILIDQENQDPEEDLETRYHPETPGQANTGLTLELYESPTGAKGWLKYRTDRYTEDQVRQLTRHFTAVAELVLSRPEESLETLTADILDKEPDAHQISREVEQILSAPAFPLSPMQHGMLMETLRAPQGAGCYVEQVVFEMAQEIDLDRFSRAWHRIAELHETLRLGFAWKGKENPEQYLFPQAPFKIEFNDWSGFEKTEQGEYLDMFLRADRRLGFSLDTPPAFRVALFKTAAAGFTCVWSFHHSIGDGRSMAVILRHLFHTYQNAEKALKPPPPFRNYIAWLHGRDRRKSRQFWRQYLAGFTEPMVFPFRVDDAQDQESRRQTHAMPLTTGHHHLDLSPVTCRAIKTLCQKNGLSINAFLMGAWAVLLSHYTGKTDVLFGTTLSTRHFDPDYREGTGLYINTLPVRIQVTPDQPLISYISQIRDQWKHIRQHDHLSLTEIHALSPIQGSSPLSEIYFSYDYQTLDEAIAPFKQEIACTRVRLLERTPAAIFLTATGTDTLKLSIEYDQRKFNARATRKILDHFSVFLKSCTRSPQSRLLDLPILTQQEAEVIQSKLNTHQGHLPPTSCVHQLFEIQAGINTHAPAVTDGQTQYTYGQLNRLANQVAHLLIGEGGGPDKKILLLLEQTPDLIAVIMGVLKSGACYVPLETTAPPERVQYIISDCRPDFIITTSDHVDLLGAAPSRRLLLDRDMERIARRPGTNPEQEISPHHLAYVIYTSGSTGRPKGVMIEHQSLAAFTKTAAQTYALEPADRVLQFAAISFDASVEEIFPTLFSGATLVTKPRELLQTPQAFFTFCRDMALSVIDLPTAYWHMIADEIQTLELPPDLRLVIIGGDAVHAERVRAWQAAVDNDIRLINTYGPTEATVAVTWEDLTGTTLDNDIVPIGVPFPSVNLNILNHFGQPAPPGVTGELFIGGPQVARGYLNRDLETGKAFITIRAAGGRTRFFKTGDFAKMLPSGQVLFLGRRDRQVKIRGYRVEPGEIEQILASCEMIKDCALVVQRTSHEEVRLTAFVVPLKSASTDEQAIKSWLRSRLPDYMIPSLFILVKALPHTASGKVDYPLLKQSLKKTDHQTPSRSEKSLSEISGDDPAKTPPDHFLIELSKLWEEILDTSDLMPEDNFFDVGGSSLTAIRLVTAIEKRFGISIPVLAIFKFPTLRDMAAQVREKDNTTHFSSVSAISEAGDRAPVFFVAGTEEQTKEYGQTDLHGHPFYKVTVFAHKTQDRKIIPMDAWEIARKNIKEILLAAPKGPYIIVGFCRYCLVAYEIASQLNAMGKQVAHLVFIDEFWQKKERPPQSADKVQSLSRRLKDWIPQTQKALRSALHRLNRKREHFYTATGKTAPDTLQVSLMESSFWQAYDTYMPMPYPGTLTVLDSSGWQETYRPRLRTYATGKIRRITVDAGHDDWFEPAQVRVIMDALNTADK